MGAIKRQGALNFFIQIKYGTLTTCKNSPMKNGENECEKY